MKRCILCDHELQVPPHILAKATTIISFSPIYSGSLSYHFPEYYIDSKNLQEAKRQYNNRRLFIQDKIFCLLKHVYQDNPERISFFRKTLSFSLDFSLRSTLYRSIEKNIIYNTLKNLNDDVLIYENANPHIVGQCTRLKELHRFSLIKRVRIIWSLFIEISAFIVQPLYILLNIICFLIFKKTSIAKQEYSLLVYGSPQGLEQLLSFSSSTDKKFLSVRYSSLYLNILSIKKGFFKFCHSGVPLVLCEVSKRIKISLSLFKCFHSSEIIYLSGALRSYLNADLEFYFILQVNNCYKKQRKHEAIDETSMLIFDDINSKTIAASFYMYNPISVVCHGLQSDRHKKYKKVFPENTVYSESTISQNNKYVKNFSDKTTSNLIKFMPLSRYTTIFIFLPRYCGGIPETLISYVTDNIACRADSANSIILIPHPSTNTKFLHNLTMLDSRNKFISAIPFKLALPLIQSNPNAVLISYMSKSIYSLPKEILASGIHILPIQLYDSALYREPMIKEEISNIHEAANVFFYDSLESLASNVLTLNDTNG